MSKQENPVERLSPWWKRSVLMIVFIGFALLIGIAFMTPRYAPPIPLKVLNPAGNTVFTRDDIVSGQEVFLRYGLMENGTVWGHGGYLGPDFSAEYLHALAVDAAAMLSRSLYGRPQADLTATEQAALGDGSPSTAQDKPLSSRYGFSCSSRHLNRHPTRIRSGNGPPTSTIPPSIGGF